jgi:hypothetical protein
MVYNCPRCEYNSEYITNFRKHINAKNICLPIKGDISLDSIRTELLVKKKDPQYTCTICEKKFASNRTLSTHNKNHHKQIDNDDRIKIMADEINELKAKLSNIGSKVENINNKIEIRSIKNQNNIIINNNVPNKFLNEDMTYISTNFAMQCAKKLNNGLIDFIKTIRFNPDHPENMNVKVHRLKKKTLYVFKNDRWEICDAKWTLEEMIIHGARILNQHLITNMDQDKLLDEDSQESRIQSWLLSILPKNNEKLLGILSNSIYALILDNNVLLMEKENE